jgi:hypothetical protein
MLFVNKIVVFNVLPTIAPLKDVSASTVFLIVPLGVTRPNSAHDASYDILVFSHQQVNMVLPGMAIGRRYCSAYLFRIEWNGKQ